MKTIATLLLACWTLVLAHAAEPEWMTDPSKAQARAKEENKLVLLEFTGSDRGGWGPKFKKESLDTEEFKEYAAKNLVLVQLDFPRKKVMSEEVKKTNQAWSKKYKVGSFPTFVLLNQDGVELGRQEGYQPGGSKAFIAKLESFRKKG